MRERPILRVFVWLVSCQATGEVFTERIPKMQPLPQWQGPARRQPTGTIRRIYE